MSDLPSDVIKAPTAIKRPFCKAEFTYTPVIGTKDIQNEENEEIRNRLTGNIVEVGEPDCWPLAELCKRQDIALPAATEMLCKTFDFWLIQSAFSFTPAQGNTFEWGRIVARMQALSEGTREPTAFDAYPRGIYEEIKGKQRINIGLDLKFAQIGGPTAGFIREIEFTQLVPEITVAGIGKSAPTWAFRKAAAFNLANVNAIYIIAKMPIGAEGIRISYPSYAQIRSHWGKLPTVARVKEGADTYEIKF